MSEDVKDNMGIEAEDSTQSEEEKVEAATLNCMTNDVMSSRSGRDFVWMLLSKYGVYQDSFDQNAIIMARNVGVKGAGLILLDLILSECPDKHNLMFAEHKYKEKPKDEM